MINDRFRPVDDFLFDRVYQPIADRAAEFDVKTRHLTAACEISCAFLFYVYVGHPFSSPSWSWLDLIPPTIFLSFAFSRLTGLLHTSDLRVFCEIRLLFIWFGSIMVLIPPLSIPFTLLHFVFICALYFAACQDKPPKRRRWQEIKTTLAKLAWIPPEAQPESVP
jgi:hypothetical protein